MTWPDTQPAFTLDFNARDQSRDQLLPRHRPLLRFSNCQNRRRDGPGGVNNSLKVRVVVVVHVRRDTI